MSLLVPKPTDLADPQLQEAKEAVVDALINLVTNRVSGDDEAGKAVLNKMPHAAFVSGFLLPRFDATGDDETSDIHISIIGIDTQIHAVSSGVLAVRPRFSQYVRVLPTWSDIRSQIDALARSFSLSPAIRQQLSQRTAALRREKRAAAGLPERITETDRDLRKTALEHVRQIKREAYQEARIELGLPPLDFDKVPFDAPLLPDSSPSAADAVPEEGTDGAVPPVVIAGTSLAAVLACPPGVLVPIEPPMKWQRLDVTLPTLEVPIDADNDALGQAIGVFNGDLANSMRASFDLWMRSPEGQDWTWRDARIEPGDLRDEAAWNAFLTRVRGSAIEVDKCQPASRDVLVDVSRMVDFADPTRLSLRISLENANRAPPRSRARQREMAIFQVGLEVALPSGSLAPLQLDRVEPSYRFRDHLSYPAMGLNCGVVAQRGPSVAFTTTWAPRWIQPRLVPVAIDVECRFSKLCDEHFDVSSLLELPKAYRAWISNASSATRAQVAAGLAGEERDRELAEFTKNLEAQERESNLIEKGIRLLADSAAAWRAIPGVSHGTKTSPPERCLPWLAWRYMNESFHQREHGDSTKGWRLFQLAFVLAHLPNIVSRHKAWEALHDPAIDEETASLLYFPTGGGKSEAFYGALVFAMFFDRLRGKNRGITGLVRYPLRLLTLQQAQRFHRLVVYAELVRLQHCVGDWPFEIGFWVGRGNTPNRVSGFASAIPSADDGRHASDEGLKKERTSAKVTQTTRAYFQDLEAYNKVPFCPVCGNATGLRRFDGVTQADRRVGIVCFTPKDHCQWNQANAGPGRTPLPFILSDDTIYQRAPSVIVGTIDKLAMLGQDLRTISPVLGMFGMARFVLPNGHLMTPRSDSDLAAVSEAGGRRVFPSYSDGEKLFHDPFPALVIQDEGHLLEESLGTFAGLFETLLEALLGRIAERHTDALGISSWNSNGHRVPRLPRVVMATATVSHPERQLETLYQRRPLLFPCPGHDIWNSFFSEPSKPPLGNAERTALSTSLPASIWPEQGAPWMRLYASIMTNGTNHTVTTVGVISAFHVEITRLWRWLQIPERQQVALDRLKGAIRGPDARWRQAALDRLGKAGRFDLLLALVDLHRVSITYVTNKKGGDQIIDALDSHTRHDHELCDVPIKLFPTRLISGGVDMRDIQEVMQLAEQGSTVGEPWPDVEAGALLRNVVATSAISHGVDVDRFNSMFFAGLPSDIAEYIQASSRVGRFHVGFVLLVPIPQSRRDRYVVETHDIYHRFLERMIATPASERWAENAEHRVAASFIQAWLALEEAEVFTARPLDSKKCEPMDLVSIVEQRVQRDRVEIGERLATFAFRAAGLAGRGPSGIGRPSDPEHYRDLMLQDAHRFVDDILSAGTGARLSDFWKEKTLSHLAPPMMSLRDVDEGALIKGSRWSDVRKKPIDGEALYYAMKIIRGQHYARSETEADEVTPDE
jgi:hypothetical protein